MAITPTSGFGGSAKVTAALDAAIDQLNDAVAVQTLVDAAPVVYNAATAWNAQVTLSASRTINAPTNAPAGARGILLITQGSGGNKLATWPSAWKFGGGTDLVLSTAAGAVDLVEWFTPDGSTFHVVRSVLALA